MGKTAVLVMEMAVDLRARVDDTIVVRTLAQHDACRDDERNKEERQEQPVLRAHDSVPL